MKSISNINEFYSEHYMAAMLATDLKSVLTRMQEAADKANEGLTGAAAKAKPVYEMLPRLKSVRESCHAEIVARTDGAWDEWNHQLLRTLGYEPKAVDVHILPPGEKDEYVLPGLLNIRGTAGPRLCAFALPAEDEDPLSIVDSTRGKTWAKLIDELFSQELAPRWAILLHAGSLLLLDRNKWFERRWLGFDFEQLFGTNDTQEWKITAAILHKDSLCPDAASCLLDDLDENSRKNAFAVSESLKDAIRECVELLGNEYVYYKHKDGHAKIYEEDTNAQAAALTLECVRFMYRLLFCFYLEARPELGFLPMGVDAYAHGYSLERLREIEQTLLETEQEEEGYFFDASLKHLFNLIWNGRNPSLTGATLDHDFEIHPLRSHLFDPERTPHLTGIRFRNKTLQQVIRKLSLGSHGRGSGARSGRVSYASLGLNQLGAVYESLLSYSGFFAKAKLWEVKPEGEKHDPAQHAFFVTEEELADYTEDERATDANGAYITHEQGEYIYRLAGSDRKASASYYTPESLTRLTVKHALKELLPGKTADDILELKVCEMAVGSASFLNEAINQLAEHYLRLKQDEVGRRIPQEDYKRELQRVKMYLADRNVTGVDLNATAVELAEVSLWLNSIYEGAFVPWFGNQLMHGNSLIGCKRHCWPAELVQRKTAADKKARWQGLSPTPYDWQSDTRPYDGIYHWLVPDEGMAPCADKVLKKLLPDQALYMKNWRKDFCKPYSKEEMQTLRQLCTRVDQLWQEHGELMRQCTELTTDALTVWPHPMPETHPTSTAQKDAILERMMKDPAAPTSRLKMAMDYWCALWFWPVEECKLLPTREDFLMDMAMILDIFNDIPRQPRLKQDLFEPDLLDEVDELPKVELDFGDNGVDKLLTSSPRLALVTQIARQQAFFHWELECDSVFRERGGFDLIVGNPPWLKVMWEEADLLGDYNPIFILRKIAADQLAKLREREFAKHPTLKSLYSQKITGFEGTKELLNAIQLYPLLVGQQPNLFKNFITRSWEISNQQSSVGFVHPEGVYDSAVGGVLRRELYPRLRAHFQFQNELKLFDIHHLVMYSVNVYGPARKKIGFTNISNIFSPRMVDECFITSSVLTPVEGIKNNRGGWSVVGHPDRAVQINEDSLSLFARLYDEEGTPANEARLPHVHATGLLKVMEKIANYPRSIASIKEQIYSSEMWHETGARKDGTIRRDTHYPDSTNRLILSGPHFYVSNPCFKTPREICKLNSDYDIIDLETLPDDYLPRVNYAPDCNWSEYVRRSPNLPWNPSKKYIDCYKLAFRRMIGTAAERTMVPVLTCGGTAHVNTVRSLTTAHRVDMLAVASIVFSIIGDFYIKTTGATDLHYQWMTLPLLPPKPSMTLRVLVLNCLTKYYSELWGDIWTQEFTQQHWYGDDPRLPRDFWCNLTKNWNRDCALRNDFARRWALCELDVLVARELGITLDELCDAYRIQFPVLKQNEDDTWYDVNGRIVFTCARSLSGGIKDRKEFEAIKHKPAGFTITKTWTDNNLPTGPVERSITYEAPFDRRDREADYKTIWEALDRDGE